MKPSATRESSFTLDSTQRDLEQRRQGLPGGSRNQREEDTGNGPSEVPPLHGKLQRHLVPEQLDEILHSELLVNILEDEIPEDVSFLDKLLDKIPGFRRNKK